MLDRVLARFAHVKSADRPWRSEGPGDFLLYKDLGVFDATNGQVVVQLVRAAKAPQRGTPWHRHEALFHILFMTRGWAKFMHEDRLTLLEAGDCLHQRPGIVHCLFDYSPDMEYLEIAAPGDFGTIEMPARCALPAPAPWPEAALCESETAGA